MNGKEKILDQLKNNHQQCKNLALARGWLLRQRSGEIELIIHRGLLLYPHRLIAHQEKNLHGVPSRESNSGLPYIKPTHFQLS